MEGDYWEYCDVDERIILKWILETWNRWHGLYLLYLAEDRNRWRAVVDAVMNLRFS
jgi:hypothetical protein